MKERPIIFNGEMVRAILDGRKTQTRRVIKPQPPSVTENGTRFTGYQYTTLPVSQGYDLIAYMDNPRYIGGCPYGQPGDRLWVREAHARIPGEDNYTAAVHYLADGRMPSVEDRHDAGLLKVFPSIYMPRWASRILLEITNVRVERVQDVSEEDAKSEGVETKPYGDHPFICTRDYSQKKRSNGGFPGFCADTGNQYRSSFRSLWNSINTKRGYEWDDNPWVWVIEFKVIYTDT